MDLDEHGLEHKPRSHNSNSISVTDAFYNAIGLIKPGLDEFHVASRSLKLVLLTGTFCATIVGASATLGMAGLGFSKGLPGAWWMLSGTVGLFVLSALFAGKIRSNRVLHFA